ncbi:MAG TPA: AsmA family protein [Bryobacteraceae bacterium]|jgi:AsmA protein|nr:AsmA family protein [Bryobacteraceae bacterium]
MRRILRWTGIVVALLLLVLLSVPFWINANDFRPMLEADLTKALGREVKLGDLKLALFSGTVSANDLSVADDPIFNRTPFVRASAMNLEIEIWPLIFSRKLNVIGLTIERPEITLIQGPSGDWNFSKLGAPTAANGEALKSQAPKSEPVSPASAKSPIQLSVKLVKITGGRFSMGTTAGHMNPLVLEQVEAELHDFSNTSVFPFSLSTKVAGGGDITLNGKAGPVDQSDVALTPVQASLNVAHLDMAGSSLGLAGVISFEGNGESKGNLIEVTGKVKAEKLKLAKRGTPARPAVELDFAIQHDLRKQSGVVRRGDIHIGRAVASLTGNYSRQGEATLVKMSLSGPGMPIPELAEMLPPLGIVLPAGSSLQGGTANAKFILEGPIDRLVTIGSLSFDNTKLTGFDLGKKMAAVESLAGIQGGPDTGIQTLSANLRMAPEGMTAQDLKLIVPAVGELTGSGTISPANTLDFKMSAAVHASGLMARVNDQPIPFTVEGTCSDPVFRPDVRAMATGEAKKLAEREAKKLGGSAAESVLKGLLGGKKKN